MKSASNLLRYLYHFLSADDVTTESFSVRVCLLISVSFVSLIVIVRLFLLENVHCARQVLIVVLKVIFMMLARMCQITSCYYVEECITTPAVAAAASSYKCCQSFHSIFFGRILRVTLRDKILFSFL